MKKGNLILNAVCVISVSFFISCKKEIKIVYQNPADSSHISITNVSPAISDLQFYLNNNLISLPNSPLSYGKTVLAIYVNNANPYSPDTTVLPYINIPSGYQQLGFGTYGNSNIFNTVNNNFEPGGNYSVFITDTVIHGQVKSIVLKDSVRKINDSTKSQIRFLNLSPDAPPLDVWAYPDAGYNGYKIFSDCAYLPDDFNSFVKAESFSVIDAGPYYFEATVAGTSNVVLGGLLMIYGKSVITIYTKGYVSGTGANAIDVGVIEYEP